ncbi:MAG: hypothetical protein ABIQ57_16610 [Candidatus Kapaibacterium sp.]
MTGLPFIAVAIAMLVEGKDVPAGIMLLLLSLFFSAGGFFWLKNVMKREKLTAAHFHEHQVLNVAAANGGYTTVLEVSQVTDMDIDEAEAAILRLCSNNRATSEIDEDGAVVYHFSGLRHTQD